jgi:hypothetical protein
MKILWFLLLSAVVAQAAPEATDITGNWKGTLAIDKATLRLVFRIGRTSEDRWVAKMDSIDQGAHDLPVDHVTFKDQTLRLQLDFLKGGFEGKVQPGGNRIEGKWSQAGKSYPLTLTKSASNDSNDEEHLSGTELAASKEAAQKLGGPWDGSLSAQGLTLPISLNIATNKAGAASGTLDSPQIGLKGIPLTGLSYRDGKVHFDARGLGVSYDGTSLNDNSSITGEWHQAEHVLPLSFKRAAVRK